ncbi:MAG: hypothetical protein JSV74_07210 [Dehalococcoidia bacterium]|nr:MAG: hypothetical protein JSV74_07210 [Dehalococcoidia bacterium]
MSDVDLIIVCVLGLFFLLLGIVAFIWGRYEEKNYYQAISTRSDVREYIQHTPERPEPGGLKIGGLIAVLLGLFTLILGVAFWLS